MHPRRRRPRLGGLAGWTATTRSTATRRRSTPRKVYADFQKALASNDDTQAGKLLDSLAGEHANSAYTQEGRLLLAKRHADAGRFDEAIKQLRQVVDNSRDEVLVHVAQLRLARLLIQTGKYDEALAAARRREGRRLRRASPRDSRRRAAGQRRRAGRASGIRRGALRRHERRDRPRDGRAEAA